MNILIVDDYPDNLFVLATLMKAYGHRVLEAGNGAQALEILEKETVDLIISDILMPVMDGFQLCRKVKGDERLAAIPFIIYTATYTGPEDEVFALKIGADRFIEKPCEPQEMMAAVCALTDGQASGEKASKPAPAEEGEVFRLYSERLVKKLEQKMLQLEKELALREATERALRESEQRLMMAQRIAKMGDLVWDMETGGLVWSEPLYELLGHEKTDAFDCDRMFGEVVHPEDTMEVRGWVEKGLALDQEHLPAHVHRVLKKDGSFLHVRSMGKVQHREGKAPLFFATLQDISEEKRSETEREKLQAQLLQAQKMESIGRLAGGVAHDFNNMLGIIMGYTDLALISLEPGNPLVQKLEEIQNAAMRSADLTRQLLAFARKQTVSPRVIHINTVISSMLKMMRRLLGEDIILDWFPGDNLWPVMLDPSQMDQILANLCVNARDAIAGTGRIVIETCNLNRDQGDRGASSLLPAGDFVLLRVRDNGCGMDAETLGKIFDPFFTTKAPHKGTGLGLATVYGIVKQNKGFIQVESRPDEGADFHIWLPRHTGGTDLHEKVLNRQDEARARGMILLVEDEKSFLEITRSMLKNQGYTVLAASSPEEALTLARENAVDLLVTDVIMPEMGGEDLAERVSVLHPGMKCLFMSGFTRDILSRQPSGEREPFFIQKPFSMQELMGKIRFLLADEETAVCPGPQDPEGR